MLPKELAEIIVENLNEHDFSQDFTAIRSYDPVWELKDIVGLKVVVTIPSLTSARHDRARRIADVLVQIGIKCKLTVTPKADPDEACGQLIEAVEPYSDLLHEISKFLFENPQQGEAVWKSEEIMLYDAPSLFSENSYAAMLAVTYQMLRD